MLVWLKPPKPKECSAFDVGCKVSEGINNWFRDLAKSAIKPVFDSLGQNLLVTPQVDQFPRVQQIWTTNVVIANTAFVLLIVAGGVIVMGHETLQTSYTVKDIAPRLVVGMIAANASATLAGKAIEIANALAAALLGDGVSLVLAEKMIKARLDDSLVTGGAFVILTVLVAVVMAVVLAAIYVVRLTLTVLLVAAAPLALALHALPQTEGLARLWWRALTGVLAIQLCQALVFVVALKVLLVPDGGLVDDESQTWDLLIIICLLYVLIRIPAWITAQIWHSGARPGLVQRFARIVVYRQLFQSALKSRRHR